MSKKNEGNLALIIFVIIGSLIYQGYESVSDYFKERSILKENAIKYQTLLNKNNEQEYITFLKERDGIYAEKVDSILWRINLKNRTFKKYIDIQDELSYKYYFSLKNINIAKDSLSNIWWKEAVLTNDFKTYFDKASSYKFKNIEITKDSLDNILWKEATLNNDFETYLEKTYLLPYEYRIGKYIDEARNIIKRNDSIIWSSEELAWAKVQKKDNSKLYNKYIEYFPNSKNYEIAKNLAIRKEVEEIFNDDKTGKLPKSNIYNKNNSKYSDVEISNNTGCELIIRYSGKSIKKFILKRGETIKISIISGNYRIAASACGTNYAGSEILSGNYSSTFYIKTVRY